MSYLNYLWKNIKPDNGFFCYNVDGGYMLIMSFNVKRIIFFKFGRYKRVVDYLKIKRPDIIGFQELNDKSLKIYTKDLDNYNIVGKGSSKNILFREYTSIFVDKKYDIISSKTYSLTSKIDNIGYKEKEDNLPRICVVCHIRDKKNKMLVVNTHIDNTDSNNKYKQLLILERIINDEIEKDEKLILMGDFNMSLNNKRMPLFVDRNRLLDPFNDYLGGSFPSRPDMRMIDHIFLRGFKCIDRCVDINSNDNGFMSDHNPIMCNIK